MQWGDWQRGIHIFQSTPRFYQQRKRPRLASRRARFELLEDRHLLAILTVNSALDNTTAGNGLVTLREAIIAANTNATTDLGQTGGGADTIQFAPNVTGSIALLLGQLTITEALTVDGPGRDVLTINAQQVSGIFSITATDGDFTFQDLTLTGGNATHGAAIRSVSSGSLTVVQSTITGNVVTGKGGGIYAKSKLAVIDSTISGNSTIGPNGRGGGFYAGNQTSVINSTISGNNASGTSGSGGGFWVSKNAVLTDSQVNGNTAIGGGGGFAVYGSLYYGLGLTTLNNTTVTGNTGSSAAGFIATYADVVDSTISGNHGTGITILHKRASTGQSLRMANSIVSGNSGAGVVVSYDSAIYDSNVSNNIGGGIRANRRLYVRSSTVTNNHAADGGGGIFAALTPSSWDVSLYDSDISGNSSDGAGGGVFVPNGRSELPDAP